MKFKNIFTIFSALCASLLLTCCEGEKDLIIIEGNLPIKTSTLFLVGDATPNGWSIDNPTPMTASDDDPLVFSWEGQLNPGEMKLCLTKGSWDAPFIRPLVAGDKIGRDGIADALFDMHAGDPDNKWKVADKGIYSLTFDLRNWIMSAKFVREADAPEIIPVQTENLYIVGSATPNGWNIDEPTALEKKSDYIFVYEGPLDAGEMKACTTTGSWDVEFVRPSYDGCKINSSGAEAADFVFTAAPDYKWVVDEPGIYRLTFDLEHFTIAAEYTGSFTPTPKLYMIGEATEGGWSWDDAIVIEASEGNDGLFVWEGELGRGSLKASSVKDFEAAFYRPAVADCEISSEGVASHEMVLTEGPDDKWLVTTAGRYRLTFNTTDMTFDAVYKGESVDFPVLYMIGDATAGGWSLDDATPVTTDTENFYQWEGILNVGAMKACFTRDFSAPFYRPADSGCEISETGASSDAMVFTTDPDDKWTVTKAGKYRLTFAMSAMKFSAQYLESAVIVPRLYMIGEATAGGWSLDDATEYNHVEGTEGTYTWTGELKTGTFKACTVKDFNAPFYRPSDNNCEISENGVSKPDVVYTTGPDDQWKVVKAGKYTITIDIVAMTISAKFIN